MYSLFNVKGFLGEFFLILFERLRTGKSLCTKVEWMFVQLVFMFEQEQVADCCESCEMLREISKFITLNTKYLTSNLTSEFFNKCGTVLTAMRRSCHAKIP